MNEFVILCHEYSYIVLKNVRIFVQKRNCLITEITAAACFVTKVKSDIPQTRADFESTIRLPSNFM